jgi:hypothetical protein
VRERSIKTRYMSNAIMVASCPARKTTLFGQAGACIVGKRNAQVTRPLFEGFFGQVAIPRFSDQLFQLGIRVWIDAKD